MRSNRDRSTSFRVMMSLYGSPYFTFSNGRFELKNAKVSGFIWRAVKNDLAYGTSFDIFTSCEEKYSKFTRAESCVLVEATIRNFLSISPVS